MAVRRLRVRNFKSFRNVEVQLSPLTALVGANASGKSNFVQLFRFLRDIARMGLENAISLQGGAEYLLNRSIGTAEPLEVELEADIVWQDLRHTEEAIH
ncbi:MAG: AAA family ATPase, partial [Armatimonadota bacterium]|nr:AAA family ATPase [Armatimonadota bacterium]